MTALFALLLPQSIAAAPQTEARRVLVFNDLGSISSPGFAAIDQAIFAALQGSPYRIEFYNENLETTLFPGKDYQREFREAYVRKYRDRKPDVIIAVGQDSLKFLVESHATAFPNVPIIFCGSTRGDGGLNKTLFKLYRFLGSRAAGSDPKGRSSITA